MTVLYVLLALGLVVALGIWVIAETAPEVVEPSQEPLFWNEGD